MRILLVEDDDDTARLISSALTRSGHLTERMMNGEDGLICMSTSDFDVIILDRMLPKVDGLDVLRQARAAGVGAPVLMLTARGAIDDRVDGLNAGADDYLVKPFALVELEARVGALGRRPRSADHDGIVSFGSLRLDRINRTVSRAGKSIVLQPREFQILDELMRHGPAVVTRAMLLKAIWRFDFDPATNIVESHVSRLRSKLNAGFPEDAIETLRGEGYRLRGGA